MKPDDPHGGLFDRLGLPRIQDRVEAWFARGDKRREARQAQRHAAFLARPHCPWHEGVWGGRCVLDPGHHGPCQTQDRYGGLRSWYGINYAGREREIFK